MRSPTAFETRGGADAPASQARNTGARFSDRLWRLGLRAAHRVLRAWWQLRRPLVHGAWVALWCEDRLLVVRNSYRGDLSLPSGGIRRREPPRQAAARELREEVGIAISPERLRFAGVVAVDYEGKRDRAHFFELELDSPPAIRVDRREVVEAAFRTPQELAGQPLVPHVRVYLERRVGAR